MVARVASLGLDLMGSGVVRHQLFHNIVDSGVAMHGGADKLAVRRDIAVLEDLLRKSASTNSGRSGTGHVGQSHSWEWNGFAELT